MVSEEQVPGQTFPSGRYNQQLVDDLAGDLGKRGDRLQALAMVACNKVDAACWFEVPHLKEKGIEKVASPFHGKRNGLRRSLF